jgi:hypothetical protein
MLISSGFCIGIVAVEDSFHGKRIPRSKEKLGNMCPCYSGAVGFPTSPQSRRRMLVPRALRGPLLPPTHLSLFYTIEAASHSLLL